MSSNAHMKVPHWWILGGLVLGAVVGCICNVLAGNGVISEDALKWIVRNITDPIGKVFLNLLFMTVVPLVFASLVVGVAKLGDLGQLGRMGLKTFGYFVLTMICGVTIGLTLVNIVAPGKGLPEESQAQLKSRFGGEAKEKETPPEFGIDTFVNMVPRNPIEAATSEKNMIGIIIFALLVGVGLTRMPGPNATLVVNGLEAVGDLMVFIIGVAMKIAPVGVFCLIFSNTSMFGFDVMLLVGKYVGVVLAGLAIQMFVVLPILVSTLGRMNPLRFFAKSKAVIITAFSTSSSAATLPTSIKTAEEELGVPAPVAGFVLPLGATMNMNGTALFEGVTVVFLAQVAGFDLSFGQQIIVVLMSVVTAIGAAGIPGGSIPLLAVVLATVGVRPDYIFLIIGVDRILDMCRTTLNVTGDLTATVFIARTEADRGELPSLKPNEPLLEQD